MIASATTSMPEKYSRSDIGLYVEMPVQGIPSNKKLFENNCLIKKQ